MSSNSYASHGLTAVLSALLSCGLAIAQDSPPAPVPAAPEAQPAPVAPTSPAIAPPTVDPKPADPKVLEDGGISIEPLYWLNRAQPTLKGGKQATGFGDLSYQGNAKAAIGVELGVPAGRSNTLRISYFRVQGNSNNTLTQDATYFSEAYSAGDYLVSTYKIQSAKISWDYLSYTWYGSKIKFKTLYEVQFANIATNQSAPLKAETTDASGNTDLNASNGSKNVVLPTFGVGFEQPIGKHFRWEAKGSGFGLPHRSVIWDAQAQLAVRVYAFEVLAGVRAFHFKTSPSGTEYFADTLDGAYVGIRYYLGQQSR